MRLFFKRMEDVFEIPELKKIEFYKPQNELNSIEFDKFGLRWSD